MFTDKETFKSAFVDKLLAMYGKSPEETTTLERLQILGSMIRESVNKNWLNSRCATRDQEEKQVYYFSLEFMLGRLLGSNLLNLNWYELCREGLAELGFDLNELEDMENDAGLGNGGLGRLAACFLDSLASLGLPGNGCGIRYRYGLFEQKIMNGYQVELPDNWLKDGNVWETRKPDKAVEVRFNGEVRMEQGPGGHLNFIHENYDSVLAIPYDLPIIGFRTDCVTTLRLWSAESSKTDFDFVCFSRGDYLKAVEAKSAVEAISQVLYPDDNNPKGKELRLKQQYFLVSAGVQSIIRHFKLYHEDVTTVPNYVAIHINDTHPVLAIPELMRILMDDHGLGWEEAWRITTRTVSYTNHTILAEALEKWPEDLFKRLLPRIYQIVEEINRRFCLQLWECYPGDWDRIRRMAVLADGHVKMAHLAVVGSYSVNGVAKLHTEILKHKEMKDFYEFFPLKFNNKTNGITHRRWLLKANPGLAGLITEAIGPDWQKHPAKLANLMPYGNDPAFCDNLEAVKLRNKERLAAVIKAQSGLVVEPASIFDVQVKRLHAYKRQLLNVLEIMNLYNRLLADPGLDIVPRTFIFGGKAAPGYHWAKSIIKLINTVAQRVNSDPCINEKIKVVFMENYRVTLAEKIMPAADISEQISTAGKEASGTGNMKFMLNGALTVGTRDGANIEIGEAVGEDNIFFFGLTSDQVQNYYQNGGYCAWDIYAEDEQVKTVCDQLINGFLPVPREEFAGIHDGLLGHDEYFVLKDFAPYSQTRTRVDQVYRDRRTWLKMCVTNIAQAGRFSSDRTVAQYAAEIWKVGR